MKIKFFCTLILITLPCLSKDLSYQIGAGDQLGSIFLSLGHLNLWNQNGKINQFKKSAPQTLDNLQPGTVIKFKESDILFKKNVTINNNQIIFNKKIKTKKEFYEMLQENDSSLLTATKLNLKITKDSSTADSSNTPLVKIDDKPIVIDASISKNETTNVLNLYLGAGGFVTLDTENDRTVTTQTMTGLQPLLQIKAIYSNSTIGSIAADLLTKQIISNQFTFPINIDYRIQYLPKWNISDSFKVALSHSSLQHSYIGKNTNTEIAYELKTNFIGLGIVMPSEHFWLELYIEKAYSGDTKSTERTQDASSGLRLDTELVYSFDNAWTVIPGINYYQLSDKKTDYKVSASEFRMTIAKEFEF